MRKGVIWSDQAKVQLRAIDQPTALRILHALAAIWKPVKATSSASKTSSLSSFDCALATTVSVSMSVNTPFASPP